jgi:hypothetical protein
VWRKRVERKGRRQSSCEIVFMQVNILFLIDCAIIYNELISSNKLWWFNLWNNYETALMLQAMSKHLIKLLLSHVYTIISVYIHFHIQYVVHATGTGTGTRLPTHQKPVPVPVVPSQGFTVWCCHR